MVYSSFTINVVTYHVLMKSRMRQFLPNLPSFHAYTVLLNTVQREDLWPRPHINAIKAYPPPKVDVYSSHQPFQ